MHIGGDELYARWACNRMHTGRTAVCKMRMQQDVYRKNCGMQNACVQKMFPQICMEKKVYCLY